MITHYFESELEQAHAAALHIEQAALCAIAARGRFTLAASGGKSPRALYEELVQRPIDWARVELFQVDERVLPLGDAARNRTLLEQALLNQLATQPVVHWMPVELPLRDARIAYERTILKALGNEPRFDLVHLGLGADGHTASLTPGDAQALGELSQLVVPTQVYLGTERLTLSFPLLRQAHELLWFIAGADKAEALQKLLLSDPNIPASRLVDVSAEAYICLNQFATAASSG
jgi:6-phosphogluconolactonase